MDKSIDYNLNALGDYTLYSNYFHICNCYKYVFCIDYTGPQNFFFFGTRTRIGD